MVVQQQCQPDGEWIYTVMVHSGDLKLYGSLKEEDLQRASLYNYTTAVRTLFRVLGRAEKDAVAATRVGDNELADLKPCDPVYIKTDATPGMYLSPSVVQLTCCSALVLYHENVHGVPLIHLFTVEKNEDGWVRKYEACVCCEELGGVTHPQVRNSMRERLESLRTYERSAKGPRRVGLPTKKRKAAPRTVSATPKKKRKGRDGTIYRCPKCKDTSHPYETDLKWNLKCHMKRCGNGRVNLGSRLRSPKVSK